MKRSFTEWEKLKKVDEGDPSLTSTDCGDPIPWTVYEYKDEYWMVQWARAHKNYEHHGFQVHRETRQVWVDQYGKIEEEHGIRDVKGIEDSNAS